MLEVLAHKPDALALIETWDAAEESSDDYTLTDNHLIESVRRKISRPQMGLLFVWKILLNSSKLNLFWKLSVISIEHSSQEPLLRQSV